MANARAIHDEHAHGRIRPRAPARRRGDDDPRSLPLRRVVVYYAQGCQLCERAREVVEAVRLEHPFELELVDIGEDADLESRYRERIPVVEIDGEPAFTYFVSPHALAARMR